MRCLVQRRKNPGQVTTWCGSASWEGSWEKALGTNSNWWSNSLSIFPHERYSKLFLVAVYDSLFTLLDQASRGWRAPALSWSQGSKISRRCLGVVEEKWTVDGGRFNCKSGLLIARCALYNFNWRLKTKKTISNFNGNISSRLAGFQVEAQWPRLLWVRG